MVINSGTDTLSYPVPDTAQQGLAQGKEKGGRALPVTLLSGFLGSGKTTLLEHILKSPDHGLRIAVIVNDMSQLNIDATLITNHHVSQTKEKLIQLQNGCICCTLRGDLLAELARLSRATEVQYVVIESTGISEPMQVAETFTAEFGAVFDNEGMGEDMDEEDKKMLIEIKNQGLHTMARLDTTVTVLDAFNIHANLDTAEFLSDRYGDEIIPEDERTISDLLVDQIEFADVLVINKVDMVDEQRLVRIRNLLKLLNPCAKVIEAKYSRVDVKEILATGRFDFLKASSGAGWLRSLHEMTMQNTANGQRMAPKPETLEYGINNFVYASRRPFHSKRLWDLLHNKFILLQNGDNEDEEDGEDGDGDEEMQDDDDEEEEEEEEEEDMKPETILQNKRTDAAFAPLLRSKGFFWLATRPFQSGEWSQAGAILTISCGGRWFAELGDKDWPEDADVRKSIEDDFEGRWGDRRQEIVLIGEGIDTDKITQALDGCLLDDDEMKQWERVMESGMGDEERQAKMMEIWEDGWEGWNEEEEEDEAGHVH